MIDECVAGTVLVGGSSDDDVHATDERMGLLQRFFFKNDMRPTKTGQSRQCRTASDMVWSL